MSYVSTAVSAISRTALASLQAVVGADKIGRHDLIVQHVATIAALALVRECPAGVGNPGDHAKVAKVFESGNMPRYAEACIGFSVALKNKGFRSLATWEEAEEEGSAMALAMLADLRPKTYTRAEMAKREEKRAKNKAAKAAEAAAAVEATKAAHLAELAAAEERGRSSMAQPLVTAQTIMDMIRAGSFGQSDLLAIAETIRATVLPLQAIAA